MRPEFVGSHKRASEKYEKVVPKIFPAMIAKAKSISHGRQVINYVLREGKLGTMLASNLIESLTPDEILKEFEMMPQQVPAF